MNDDDPPPGAPAAPPAESAPAAVAGPGAEPAAARRRLAQLRQEHEDLDACVQALESVGHPDQIRIARLKKKKLGLRDEIVRLDDALLPDIIA